MSDTVYTLQEVASNNGRNGSKLWVIIDGHVVDLTKYIEDHPGGEEVIMEYAGRDATKAFNKNGHSNDAVKLVKQHRIGKLKVENTNDGIPIKIDSDSTEQRRSCLSMITCGICC